jgi:hypothetical protein
VNTAPGAVTTTLHLFITYECSQKASMFVTGKPFRECNITLQLIGPTPMSIRIRIVVNTAHGAVFTGLDFLHNLQMLPIS